MQERLGEAEQAAHFLDLVLAYMSQGLCHYDAEERVVLCNRRYQEMLGLEPGAVRPGMTFAEVLRQAISHDGLDDAEIGRRVEQVRSARGRTVGVTHRIRSMEQRRHGRFIAVSYGVLPDGGWVVTLDDVTDQHLAEGRITRLAHFDTLTGLANRASFLERLRATVHGEAGHGGEGQGEAGSAALLYIDLDGFKPVNDTLGHPAGDAVLQMVAERLRATVPEGGIVARLGGDEFAVLLPGAGRAADAAALAERIIAEVARPLQVGAEQVRIGASIGIALAPQHARDADLLLRNVDLALYRAKATGRSRHCVYEPAMALAAQWRHDMERDLRGALANDEFTLHYQPVVDTRRHVVTGFEALLRWSSPSRGALSPVAFIPLAEELGLMPRIGEWVLRTACREAAGWPADMRVSVNLSPKQFRQPDLAAQVAAILEESGLAPHRLELEITETAMIDDVSAAAAVLQRLRALGVQVALDDFGTGCSSLSFVHSLPFTRIKIDRSFVQGLGDRPEALAVVRAVAGLCGSLGVTVTAEGVESHQQLALLSAENCFEVQGFLFSRPCPAPQAQSWATSFRDVDPTAT